jgi:hypothetical protein
VRAWSPTKGRKNTDRHYLERKFYKAIERYQSRQAEVPSNVDTKKITLRFYHSQGTKKKRQENI